MTRVRLPNRRPSTTIETAFQSRCAQKEPEDCSTMAELELLRWKMKLNRSFSAAMERRFAEAHHKLASRHKEERK